MLHPDAIDGETTGLSLPRSSAESASRKADGTFNLKFQLSRNPLVQLTAITLAVTAAMFMLLVVTLHKVETIAAAVASFFFSVWSVRGIFASQLKTFPTLLDCYILTLCAILLVLLCWKVILSKTFRPNLPLPRDGGVESGKRKNSLRTRQGRE